jgi:hypothetical protein
MAAAAPADQDLFSDFGAFVMSFGAPTPPKITPAPTPPPVPAPLPPPARSNEAVQKAERDVRTTFGTAGRTRTLLTAGRGAGVLSPVAATKKRLLGE